MSPRCLTVAAMAAHLAACAAERPSVQPDDAGTTLVAQGQGPTPQAAHLDARRALARRMARLVGPAWPDWWSYVGAMRREGFPTAVATDLLNPDRFEAAADQLGVGVEPLPPVDGRHRARAALDRDRLLAAYDAEIARADEAIARLQAERHLWSEQSWAALERVIADIRAGREHLAEARDRVRERLAVP